MKQLILLLCLVLSTAKVEAQPKFSASPIIFIYDASGSMWGRMEGQIKMEVASTVLSEALDQLPQDQQIGLVAYGHRREKDCEDVEFLIGMENTNKEQVRLALKKIKPLGRTPLAYAALKVIEQLRETKAKATIILVTDGIEACGGNLCDVIRAAKTDGINFKLHIIGFGLNNADTGPLKCAAEAGDGQYYDAADSDGLVEGLNEATSASIDSVAYVKPVQPEKNFSVYAVKNGQAIDALVVATLAGTDKEASLTRTYGDTSYLSLSPGKYNLSFTLVNSDVDAIEVYDIDVFPDSAGHQTMNFDAGKIELKTTKNGKAWDAVYSVFSKSTRKKVRGGRTYGKPTVSELNPGRYDLEVTAMKLKGPEIKYRIKNIDVRAGETSAVQHDFKSGTLKVFSSNNGEGWDSVVKVTSAGEGVSGGRTYGKQQAYLLNPGLYEVTFEAMHINGLGKKSQTESVEVKLNEEAIINHNFKSGILKIGARSDGQLVKAVVKIKETKSGKNYGGGITGIEASANPKEMTLSPATYNVSIKEVESGKEKEFSIELKAEEVVERMIDF